jgi:four helix bundle protein
LESKSKRNFIVYGIFQRFEDIKAWQKARELNRTIYFITSKDSFSKDFGLRDQIRRASVSIMANIAEGFGRRTNKDFANFLVIAHGSAAETQSHLYIALDLKYISDEIFKELYQLLDEISRMTMALCQHLRKT